MQTASQRRAAQAVSPAQSGSSDTIVIDLYKKQEKIYAREVNGRYQRLRKLSVWLLLGLYYLLPWIQINGQQLVLFDLPARRFHVFGLTFWPQDFILLTGLLVLAALSLFFFTALAGRLWCGFACPQTVWTEVFMWLEQFAEGPAHKRRKLDQRPWNAGKVRRKALKHGLWLLFALWTGFTFVGFFTPIIDLGQRLLSLQLGGWETFWIAFYSLATWGNAGFLREQVCKYMCPYARFQSAMFDSDTLIVSYDPARGEPRGSRSRELSHAQVQEQGKGDCIDCTLCVQVCPTGIDIRDGLQYECITCAACIDVCNQVMERMNYPLGLIRFTTQNAIDQQPGRVLRPRILLYGALLVLVAALWVYGVASRPPVLLDVMRDRNALYRELADGAIENSYTLRISNRTDARHDFAVSVSGLDQLHIAGPQTISLQPGAVGSLPIILQAADVRHGGRHDIEFTVVATDDAAVSGSAESRFFVPLR